MGGGKMTISLDLLTNGDFEQPWAGSHKAKVFPVGGEPFELDVGNIFTPPGWTAWYRHQEGSYAQPECRYNNAPERVKSGSQGFLLFTFSRIHDAGLYQQVNVAPGTEIRLKAWAHAWSNHKDLAQPDRFPHPDESDWSEGAGYDPFAMWTGSPFFDSLTDQDLKDKLRNFTFSIGIDPFGGTDPFSPNVLWGRGHHIYNEFYELSASATAASHQVTVFLRSATLWPFKHNDANWDAVSLKPEGTVVIPPVRGRPRVQYERTVVLLPGQYGVEWYEGAARGAHPRSWSVITSADDAGIGDLDFRRVIAVNPEQIGTGLTQAWFDQHYEGAVMHTLNALTPQELTHKLVNWRDPVPGPDPEPPPPPPPPPPEPNREWLSLHVQTWEPEVEEYIKAFADAGRPLAWVKLVLNFEMAKRVKELSPQTKVLARWHTGDYGRYLPPTPPQEGAELYLNNFWDSIATNSEWIDAVEGTNELFATGDPKVPGRVALEAAISNEVAKRSSFLDHAVAACILNIAIGNIDIATVLLPAIEAAVKNGHYIGYHPYFPVHPEQDRTRAWMNEEGRYHHLRHLLLWDRQFTGRGYYPRYLGTEGGGIAAEKRPEDGRPSHYLAHSGWKDPHCMNGDLEFYIEMLLRHRELTRSLPNGSRDEACMIFTTGNPNIIKQWVSFIMNAELIPLSNALLA
jgi:hypothetical protein